MYLTQTEKELLAWSLASLTNRLFPCTHPFQNQCFLSLTSTENTWAWEEEASSAHRPPCASLRSLAWAGTAGKDRPWG